MSHLLNVLNLYDFVDHHMHGPKCVDATMHDNNPKPHDQEHPHA